MPSATVPPQPRVPEVKNPHSTLPLSFKSELKPFFRHTTNMPDLSQSSSSGPIRIDGSEFDVALSNSDFLSKTELLNRRARRVKQLARIYRHHYWALMEELKSKYREYYLEYGKGPFIEADQIEKINLNCGDCSAVIADNVNNRSLGGNGGNSNSEVASRCGVRRCKAKALALTRFCHMHILSDAKQKLYKDCSFPINSTTAGPILCSNPVLRSAVPSYCSRHFQIAEKSMACALKEAGLNVSSTRKLAPKFHVIIAEYVRQIQIMRRAAEKTNLEIAEVKEDNNS